MFFHLTIVFGACALVSALNRPIPEVLPGLFVLLPKLVLVLILIDILDDRRHVDLGVGALLVSSAMVACIGIAQFSLYVLRGVGPVTGSAGLPALHNLRGLTLLRASGLQHTPHSYAQPLAVVVAMALALAAVATGWRRAGLLLIASLVLLPSCSASRGDNG